MLPTALYGALLNSKNEIEKIQTEKMITGNDSEFLQSVHLPTRVVSESEFLKI